ncbi:hypothetical protein BH24ACT5_BH24ACT5_05660 [soil metagenome]
MFPFLPASLAVDRHRDLLEQSAHRRRLGQAARQARAARLPRRAGVLTNRAARLVESTHT